MQIFLKSIIIINFKKSDVIEIAAFCEILHNASLIIDDIEDNSDFRREKKCIHKIYGIDVSINAANFLYFKSF